MISARGEFLSDELQLTFDEGNDQRPIAAWNGSELGIFYSINSIAGREVGEGIEFMRVTSAGTPVGRSILAVDSPVITPHHAIWAEDRYALVWSDLRHYVPGAGNNEIYFQTFDERGMPLCAESRITDALGDSTYPYSIEAGGSFGLIWDDHRTGDSNAHYASTQFDCTINPGGDTILFEESPGDVHSPSSMVFIDGEYLVSWSARDASEADSELFIGRFPEGGGLVTEPRNVTTNDIDEEMSLLLLSDDEIGLAWIEDNDPGLDLNFVRLGLDGVPIDGSQVEIADIHRSSEVFRPTMIWTGDAYVTAWIQGPSEFDSDIYMTWICPPL
jgi:hypothetical protein